jgi:hypothetical protein
MTDLKHICRLETTRKEHICANGKIVIIKNPACSVPCPQAMYIQYVIEFNKKKAVVEAKREAMEERLKVLGLSANVIMNYDYDSRERPMDFDEWREWEAGAEQRRLDALEREKEREKERLAENERRRLLNEASSKTFNDYLDSLPKTYTPTEWRTVAKTLPIKIKPVPRGTVSITCEKNGSSITVRYAKSPK